MYLETEQILQKPSFGTVNYRDSRYQGSVTFNPASKMPVKQGPGILFLDRNHWIIAKWKNNEMQDKQSVILTSQNAILDTSAEQLSDGMDIKYIDTFQNYVLIGNIEENKWLIQDFGENAGSTFMKLQKNSYPPIFEEFRETSFNQNGIKQEYDSLIRKLSRILSDERRDNQKKFQFKVIESQNCRLKGSQKHKEIGIITTTHPQKVNIEFEHSYQKGDQHNIRIKGIEYFDGDNEKQLSYKIDEITTGFTDTRFLRFEDKVGSQTFQYFINPETSQFYENAKQMQKGEQSRQLNVKKHSKLTNKSYQVLANTQRDSSRQMIQRAKTEYFMKGVNFVNESHFGFTKSIDVIIKVIKSVYSKYKQQTMKRWIGELDNKNERFLDIKSATVRDNKDCFQFEVSQEDIKQELRKIKNGEYKHKTKKAKKNVNLNKTYTHHLHEHNTQNQHRLSNCPKYDYSATRNNRSNGSFNCYFIQENKRKDEFKISRALEQIKKSKRSPRKSREEDQRKIEVNKKLYFENRNQDEKPKSAKKVKQESVHKLTQDYFYIQQEIQQESRIKGVPYHQLYTKPKESVFDRNYKYTLEKHRNNL